MLKVLHIIPSFYPAHIYGGPIESVYRLTQALRRRGCEVRVLTTDANGPYKTLDVVTNKEISLCEGISVRYCKRWAGDDISLHYLRVLSSYIRWADLVHLTAVYSFPTIPALLGCRIYGKPLVWSPRGSLQRWHMSRHCWSKAIWDWICRGVSPRALMAHATSEAEAIESAERLGGVKTVVVPNGMDIPAEVAHIECRERLRLLYLGRLHPIKGIENLLSACELLNRNSGRAWSLSIAGGGERHYTEFIQARIAKLGLSSQVNMVGEVLGRSKRALFANSDIAVAPSYKENFGMVIAEALAHGVPVIAGQGTPWRVTEEIRCGLWVENSPESLAAAIERMRELDLQAMGRRGREWIAEEFSWDKQACLLARSYADLLDHGVEQEEAKIYERL
ncbi:MAG: glycosyltransferase [Acidobacteria bacterium]|nr:glycosyltransferase [Acidobacteriota bacterium]MBI3657589.1 glycosyltransferase [Acidobacteriota bacterium]